MIGTCSKCGVPTRFACEIGQPHGVRCEKCREATEASRQIMRGAESAVIRDLITALETTKGWLRKLQPSLNVMAQECLDDIIKENIDEPLANLAALRDGAKKSGENGQPEEKSK